MLKAGSEYHPGDYSNRTRALQKAVPEWKERLDRLGEPGGEDPHKVAAEYCRAIAHIIVTQGSDYVPDGTIDGEADFT